jgi:cation transporter-like permease
MTARQHRYSPLSSIHVKALLPPRRRRREMAMLIGLLGISGMPIRVALSFSPLFRAPCHRPSVSTRGRRLWVHRDVSTNSSSVEVLPIDISTRTNLEYNLLQEENSLLRKTIRELELENERLKNSASRIVIENFEGEGRLAPESIWFEGIGTHVSPEAEQVDGITMSSEQMEASQQLWCDELDNDTCPVEPTISFGEALRDRAYWLVGLLAMQSCSGFILARNEMLLETHPVIIYFLTMLVGAGGNAGNQASVRVIRGLALGTLNERTQKQFLLRELKMAGALSAILSLAGFLRAIVFQTPFAETIAVTSALMLIVFSSICLGAVLPLLLKKMGVDPAHSSTSIQVVMDILGVFLTVIVSSLILDTPIGQMLTSKLSFSS